MPVIYYTEYAASGPVSEISRLEHDLGRALLIKGLNEIYGLSYDSEDTSSITAADSNGKPYLPDHPDICFNITHCTGLVACAFHSSPVGIDAELPGYFPEILIDKALTDNEKSFLTSAGCTPDLRNEWFYRFWTLKEAYVKKSGAGVEHNLLSVFFAFDYGVLGVNTGSFHVTCSDPDVSCFQVKFESGHILSICCEHAMEGCHFLLVPCSSDCGNNYIALDL